MDVWSRNCEVHGASLRQVREVLESLLHVVLRLPGLILLELWWRNRNLNFDEIRKEMLKQPAISYVDMPTFLDFVQRRNFDTSAAFILSCSVLLLAVVLLASSLKKILVLYCHVLSIGLFAFAHYLSATYVQLEQESGVEEIKLDNFVKLERHGFHFLAQVLLGIVQSVVLGIESDVGRLCLPVFALPIAARMSGCPLHKLILAHNFACCAAMLSMCAYMLFCTPIMAKSIRTAFRRLRAIFVIRGVVSGCALVWRRLQITQVMTAAWIAMFAARIYVEIFDKGRTWREATSIVLAAVAESTNTPLTLLSLALTVSYAVSLIVTLAQLAVGSSAPRVHVLAHSGCTEACTLILLCTQTGVLGMDPDRKRFLLGLVMFLVCSALMQSLFDLLEPQLLSIASCPFASRARHVRCLILSGLLITVPIATSVTIVNVLPVDLWSVIIVGNNLLTAVHTLSALLQYAITIYESRRCDAETDNWVFCVRSCTQCVELFIAVVVAIFGCHFNLTQKCTLASSGVLAFHIVLNVYRRLKVLLTSLRSRSSACSNLTLMRQATKDELTNLKELCAICMVEMHDEARVTSCRHFFHATCLRKWLSVKQVCPLCYTDMSEVKAHPPPEPILDSTEHDTWPLLIQRHADD